MKSKPIIWVALLAAAGLCAAVYFHFSKKSGAQSPAQRMAENNPRSKKVAFNHVQAIPLAEASHAGLSAGIQPLFAVNNSYEQRAAAVRTITTNLATVDLDALYSFLLTRNSADDNQDGQVLKNDLMDALTLLNPPPARLADLLVQLYHDRTQNEVIRDYAVQHLATFMQRMSGASDELRRDRSFEITEADSVLWEGLAETDDSIAGTALLGLERIARTEPDFDAKQVAVAALQLGQNKNAGELSRITALQVCSHMRVSEALPLALDAAQGGESVPLRISALGAIGELGGAEQTLLLESLIQGADERLKLPAQHALNQINQRLSLASSGH